VGGRHPDRKNTIPVGNRNVLATLTGKTKSYADRESKFRLGEKRTTLLTPGCFGQDNRRASAQGCIRKSASEEAEGIKSERLEDAHENSSEVPQLKGTATSPELVKEGESKIKQSEGTSE